MRIKKQPARCEQASETPRASILSRCPASNNRGERELLARLRSVERRFDTRRPGRDTGEVQFYSPVPVGETALPLGANAKVKRITARGAVMCENRRSVAPENGVTNPS